MCLPHEYGIAHSNEMGTEQWRIEQVRRLEGDTMLTLTINRSVRHAATPQDLRTQLDPIQDQAALFTQRRAATDRVIAFYGDDTKAATEVLVMLGLVA